MLVLVEIDGKRPHPVLPEGAGPYGFSLIELIQLKSFGGFERSSVPPSVRDLLRISSDLKYEVDLTSGHLFRVSIMAKAIFIAVVPLSVSSSRWQ